MAEQIYTIPVNDAFDSGCECPMCQMQKDLERNAIEYTMGPSYMEDIYNTLRLIASRIKIAVSV